MHTSETVVGTDCICMWNASQRGNLLGLRPPTGRAQGHFSIDQLEHLEDATAGFVRTLPNADEARVLIVIPQPFCPTVQDDVRATDELGSSLDSCLGELEKAFRIAGGSRASLANWTIRYPLAVLASVASSPKR